MGAEDWLLQRIKFPAPRLDFLLGGRRVSFEDVNQKELRVAELSRFDQTTMLLQHIVDPPPCCSCSANATAASLGKVGGKPS